jgi:hypothetical protein
MLLRLRSHLDRPLNQFNSPNLKAPIRTLSQARHLRHSRPVVQTWLLMAKATKRGLWWAGVLVVATPG